MLNPRLPDEWQSLGFKLVYHDNLLDVTIRRDGIALKAHDDNPSSLKVNIRNQSMTLEPGADSTVAYGE